MKFGVLTLDYDGTIATDGVLFPDVRSAIAEARARGIVVTIATGRILSDLRSLCGDHSFVDAVVAENGAVLAFPNGQTRILGRLPPQIFFDALQRRGVASKSGQCIVEAEASAAPAILAAIRELQLPLVILFNRGRLMVLEQAISKGTGLRNALHVLRLSPSNFSQPWMSRPTPEFQSWRSKPAKLESSMSSVQVEQKSYEMPPRVGFTVAHFLTVADIDRSARFYEKVFGGRILSRGDSNGGPRYIQIANTWLIVNVGGGPTPDKPSVTLSVLADPDKISSFMNIRVADIQACYELWRSRGAEFITEPKDKHGETRCYIRDPDGYIIEVGQSKPDFAYR